MSKSTYEVIEHPEFGRSIKRTDPNGEIWSFLEDPANSDYQRYLRWLENPDADESGTL